MVVILHPKTFGYKKLNKWGPGQLDGRAHDSGSEVRRFDSQQENFRHQSKLSVLIFILASVPPPCVIAAAHKKIPVILMRDTLTRENTVMRQPPTHRQFPRLYPPLHHCLLLLLLESLDVKVVHAAGGEQGGGQHGDVPVLLHRWVRLQLQAGWP